MLWPSRDRARFPVWIAILCGFLVLACTALPRHPRPSDFDGAGDAFSGNLVEAHLAALQGLGARSPGNESDELARAYLSREFRLGGARIDPVGGEDGREHLIAEQTGASSDAVFVVTAYPVLGLERGIDATGVAVLVELARVLGFREQPYTVRFALVETRTSSPGSTGVRDDDGSTSQVRERVDVATPGHREARLIEAGRDLAGALEADGRSERVRAIIVLDLSFHPNLVFLRDLGSHPGFREIFWSSAARFGFEAMFPTDAVWASPTGLQLGFQERSMDRIVALVDVFPESGMGTRGRGRSRRDSDLERTIQTLDSLGEVMVDALGRLMERLEKVDAFTQ